MILEEPEELFQRHFLGGDGKAATNPPPVPLRPLTHPELTRLGTIIMV